VVLCCCQSSMSIAPLFPTYPSTLTLHDALPISAGTSTKLSIAPKLSANVITLSCSTNALGSNPGCNSKEIMAPKPCICFLATSRSEEHTSELQSRFDLVCRLLLEKKKTHH